MAKFSKFEEERDRVKVMESAVRVLLCNIGEDTNREGLVDTPARVVRSYAELFSGYRYEEEDIGKMLKVFTDGACDEVVLLKGIEFVSFCEHHMLPFTGKAHIAYLPKGRVLGVSKMARLLDVFARRLQIQERLCQQVTTSMDLHLAPEGSACIIEGVHACMGCRGVRKQNAVMVTSSLTGVFRDNTDSRNELFALIRS